MVDRVAAAKPGRMKMMSSSCMISPVTNRSPSHRQPVRLAPRFQPGLEEKLHGQTSTSQPSGVLDVVGLGAAGRSDPGNGRTSGKVPKMHLLLRVTELFAVT